MHPHFLAVIAAQHVKDMQQMAAHDQRVRDARRTRRSRSASRAQAAAPASAARQGQPCPQRSYSARAA